MLLAAGVGVVLGCGWVGTEHSVRFNGWLSYRDMQRLPPLPTMAGGLTQARAYRDFEDEEEWLEKEGTAEKRVEEIDSLWTSAGEARQRGDWHAARELLSRYLERTAVGRDHRAEPTNRQRRRNSGIDQLDALSALDQGTDASAVGAYLIARQDFDGESPADATLRALDAVPRGVGLDDNIAYFRAAVLYEGGELAAAAEAFAALTERHPRSEKREAALFMAAVATMKTSRRFTGTSGDPEHLRQEGVRWDGSAKKYIEPPSAEAVELDEVWHKARAGFLRVMREYPRGRYARDARGWLAHLLLRAHDRAGALVEYYRLLGDESDEGARVEAAFSLTLVRHHASGEEMRRVETELEDEPAAALAYAYHNIYNYAVDAGCTLGPWFRYYPHNEWEAQQARREKHNTERAEKERIVAFATRMMSRYPRAATGGSFALRVAQANAELDNYKDARAQAARALQMGVRDGERLRALWVKGLAEHRLGDQAAARRTLGTLVDEDRRHELTEGARRLIAMSAEDAGDLDAALEQYIALGYTLDVAYFVDVLMTPEQLAAFVERRPASPLRDELLYSLGLRYLRAGRYAEARAAYARVRTTQFEADDGIYSYDDYGSCEGWRRCSPKNPYFSLADAPGVRPRWVMHDLQVARDLEALERKVETSAGDEEKAEALYQLASYTYESSTLLFYNPAVWGGARYRNLSELHQKSAYRAPDEARRLWEYMQEHDTLAHALPIYLRVADEYPRTRAARDALYTAAVSHDILAGFNPYWRDLYEKGMHAGARPISYDDVKRIYPSYQLPRGTNGWQPATRTVNGGPAWVVPPKPKQLTGMERARLKIERAERRAAKGWELFGEVAGGQARRWTLAALRWSLVLLVSAGILLVFRLTRRSRAVLFELLTCAVRRRTPTVEVLPAQASSYGAHEPYLPGARARAASRDVWRGLWQIVLDEKGRAALALNFVTHGLLTALVYALMWAITKG